ncbi:peroxisomal membrane protein 2-like [Physella acuta]|uniref:peroxisomal membrane protein 2-like n=1 Tax=Physella acuta TaxID=109671 RepID=UPI0027DC99C3|nr:peroxisomal membrane protein 2-like [Physella acuta]
MAGNPKSSKKDDGILNKALQQYIRLLQEKPVITKATTNAIVSGVGNIISQIAAPDKSAGGRINWRSVFAYTSFGFLVNGPLIHHFYAFLEKLFPKNQPNSQWKKVLFDRIVFAPPFLLIFLYYVSIIEGHGNKGAVKRIRETYWMILKLNWSVWSIVQYINMNYVPLKFRTLFGNICALVWMVFISIKRRQVSG